MSRFTSLKSALSPRGVAELVGKDTSPSPEGFTRSSTRVMSKDFDINRPEDNLSEYWGEYETNPFISQPINNLASEVIEPGWRIEADSEKTKKELEEFCKNVGIKGGHIHQDLSDFIKTSVIQHQVRGTFLAEKDRDEEGRHIALNPLQPETFKIYTKPGRSILVAPDQTDLDVKLTDDGDASAYVQWDTRRSAWEDKSERRFARNEMMHWPRNPDVGDVFGTSRVESIYDRARAVRAKLRDNDDAIAMKAWPMVLFQLGSEDNPWTMEEQKNFMSKYSEGNLGPGMYQGVPGDVEIKEFAGETANIRKHVDTDVDFILAGMPGPKYSLGAFADETSKTVASAQERQFKKLVRDIRRELEGLFTPYLIDVAESWDLDSSGVELKLGRPAGEVAPEDIQGSIIRYQSDANDEDESSGTQNDVQDGDGDGVVNDGSGDERPAPEEDGGDDGIVNLESVSEELADPRLVSTSDAETEMSAVIETAFLRTRDAVLTSIISGDGSPTRRSIESAVEREFATERENLDLDGVVTEELESVASDTLTTLSQGNHAPQIEREFSAVHRSVVTRQTTNVMEDVRSLTGDLSDTIVDHVQRVEEGGGSLSRARERVMEDFDVDEIETRSQLIARMRSQRMVGEIKLAEYRRHDDIVGVRVINACTDSTTELCEQLAGCSGRDSATAYFDAEESIGEQLEEQVTADLYTGFKPLNATPPFHWGCRSGLAPIRE